MVGGEGSRHLYLYTGLGAFENVLAFFERKQDSCPGKLEAAIRRLRHSWTNYAPAEESRNQAIARNQRIWRRHRWHYLILGHDLSVQKFVTIREPHRSTWIRCKRKPTWLSTLIVVQNAHRPRRKSDKSKTLSSALTTSLCHIPPCLPIKIPEIAVWTSGISASAIGHDLGQ